MGPFLRDSPVWNHKDHLRHTSSDPISPCQPVVVKVLLEAREQKLTQPKMEFSRRMPECVTRWREAEEPGSRKGRDQAILSLSNRVLWAVAAEHSH